MTHTIIKTTGAPGPKRHFSQGSRHGPLIFTSGQGPVDPATGTIVTSDIAEQTRQTLANLAAILAAEGSSLAHALKVNVYLRRMEDIAKVDEVFREMFPGEPPPRTAIGAALGSPGSPDRPGMDIEIDLVAYVPVRDE
ncbi:MAG TPA: RidA family protein [Bauldia sp.]|nr:RidA family protein [Bauldia sp.]